MLEQNPVILLSLWISITGVSCFGMKKKLIYYTKLYYTKFYTLNAGIHLCAHSDFSVTVTGLRSSRYLYKV